LEDLHDGLRLHCFEPFPLWVSHAFVAKGLTLIKRGVCLLLQVSSTEPQHFGIHGSVGLDVFTTPFLERLKLLENQ
jgi:hypothetical protein